MTITYLVDGYYNGADELGVAWDDPAIDADWGLESPVLSERDQKNPARSELDPQFQPHVALRTGPAFRGRPGAGFRRERRRSPVVAELTGEIPVLRDESDRDRSLSPRWVALHPKFRTTAQDSRVA
jgi:hypothetical protein